MWISIVIFYIITLLLSLLGLQLHINIFKYPLYLTIPITLAVFIPLSIIFLLPLDYIGFNYNLNNNNNNLWFSLSNNIILLLWKLNYWITFLLTWLILPFLQEFFKSGQISTIGKIKDSIISNLKYQIILIGIFIICIIYLYFEIGLNFTSLKLMVIAVSHLYSLILATWLMGHGLISIPRIKWIQGSNIKNLNYNYLKIPKILDELEDLKMNLKDDILTILKLQRNLNIDDEDFIYRDYILNLYNKIPIDLKNQVEKQYLHDTSNIERNEINENFLIKLSSQFNLNLHKLIGTESDFNLIVNKIVKLEDILNSITFKRLNFRTESNRVLINSKFNFYYWYYIYPISARLFSILLGLFSIIILESEFFHSTKYSLIQIIINKVSSSPTIQFFTMLTLFSYILISSLNSLTKLKIFNIYNLVAFKSDPISVCWYTTYIARLTIPLSYNFLTLFIIRKSNFENWYGQSIHLTGLFNYLNNWLPRLILIPVLLAIFNVYEKLKKKLGFNNFYDSWIEFNDEDEQEEINSNNLELKRKDLIIVEAKRIVNRELQKRQLNLKPFNLTNNNNNNNNDLLNTTNNNNYADLNYNRNQQQFNDELMNRDRIDETNYENNNYENNNNENYQDEDEDEDDIYYDGIISSNNNNNYNNNYNINNNQQQQQQQQQQHQNIWTNVKNSIGGLFNRNNQPYRDEPLEEFNYDDDANENLIL
ncbi:unnamed protein product [Candida verbasci]|uniref:LMBR1-domain-containing protein n=1 Tax=Candida verbasci TaxID=1227364 RepID=A0A9W4XJM1_9ASCO|nr:unnamed protein product [Candida verbasci]